MLSDPKIQVSSTLARRPGRPTRHTVRRLARRLRRVGAQLRMPEDRWTTLSVRIVDDTEMADLHVRFMGEEGPTDVLSFPAGDPEAFVLGDIALDWEAIARQAAGAHEHARLDEATVLAVHGLAHLLGHDHGTPAEGRRMHRLEARLLRGIGVPDVPRPYVRRLDVATHGRAWS